MPKRKLGDTVDIEIDGETGILRPLKKVRADHETTDSADAAGSNSEGEVTDLSDFHSE